jgi:hypothetical protein
MGLAVSSERKENNVKKERTETAIQIPRVTGDKCHNAYQYDTAYPLPDFVENKRLALLAI